MVENDTYKLIIGDSSQASDKKTLVRNFRVEEAWWWSGL